MSNYLPDPIGKMIVGEDIAGCRWPEGSDRPAT